MPLIDLDPARERIFFEASWIEQHDLQRIPGVERVPGRDRWEAPLSYATCVTARGVFGPQLVVGSNLNDWVGVELRGRIEPALSLRERVALELPDPAAYDPGLYDFQRVDREFLVASVSGQRTGGALLSNEQGLGKTVSILTALRQLGEEGRDVYPILVVSPNAVKPHWGASAQRWLPGAEPFIVAGTASERQRVLRDAAGARDRAVVVVNIEYVRALSRLAPYGSIALRRCRQCDPRAGLAGLPATRCDVHPKPLNQFGFTSMVLDEAHRIKDPTSQQTRACWAVGHGPTVRQRFAATGTPLANAPDELWSIMHFLTPDEYPVKGTWVDRYGAWAYNYQGGMDLVGLNTEHLAEFERYFRPRHRRMLKAVVTPQLPPKIHSQRFVQMTPKQAKAYRELSRYLLTELADGQLLTTPDHLQKAIRLVQFASAYAEIDPLTGKVHLAERSPKLDDLEEVLAERRGADGLVAPTAVTAVSRQLILLAAARLDKLGISYGLIVGGQKEWERELALTRFQEGKLSVLLFTMGAGGTGLTMTRTDTLVRLQRSWSMIENLQTEDRVHRIGAEQHEAIHIIDILTEHSIETAIQGPRYFEKRLRLEQIQRDRDQLLAAGRLEDVARLDNEMNKLATGYVHG